MKVIKVAAAPAAKQTIARHVGIVVSSGKMAKTVKVRVPTQHHSKLLDKSFQKHKTLHAHDEHNALIEGDVVRLQSGYGRTKLKTYIVTEIVSPFRASRERAKKRQSLVAEAAATLLARREAGRQKGAETVFTPAAVRRAQGTAMKEIMAAGGKDVADEVDNPLKRAFATTVRTIVTDEKNAHWVPAL